MWYDFGLSSVPNYQESQGSLKTKEVTSPGIDALNMVRGLSQRKRVTSKNWKREEIRFFFYPRDSKKKQDTYQTLILA